jgi:hypothetical protein
MYRSPLRSTFLLASLCLGAAGPVTADEDVLRCGSQLISPGPEMDVTTVQAQCGAPASRKKEVVPHRERRANGSSYETGTVTVETWTYDRGSGRFPAILHFEDGKLVSIEFSTQRQ